MPLPLNDDLATIFNTDEFAVTATYRRDGARGDSSVNGVFDNETVPVETGGFVPVHEEQPRFTCRTADLPSLIEGDELVLSGVVYTIRSWIHDGTGMTVLSLELK
jgi:hypothetical protein